MSKLPKVTQSNKQQNKISNPGILTPVVSKGSCCKATQVVENKKYIVSWFWRPGARNQAVSRDICTLKPGRESFLTSLQVLAASGCPFTGRPLHSLVFSCLTSSLCLVITWHSPCVSVSPACLLVRTPVVSHLGAILFQYDYI